MATRSAGERKTARALTPLLGEGWKVRRDIDLGRGSADYVLLKSGRKPARGLDEARFFIDDGM
jgi:hypothetical protein